MIIWSGIILFLLIAARLWGLDALGDWLSISSEQLEAPV